MWSLIPVIVYISFTIGRRGFGCEDESFGGVTFDIIFCMSHFNRVLSVDTLRQDAISSLSCLYVCMGLHVFYLFISSVCDLNLWKLTIR